MTPMKPLRYRDPIFFLAMAYDTALLTKRTQRLTAEANELLKVSEPDTFLGKQHYPIIPLPHEEE